MTAHEVTLPGSVPAAAAHPDGEPRGGVVVLQEAFGLTHHIRSVCSRLADAGYLAVAPALFHRAGAPAPVIDYERMDQARPLMAELHIDEMTSDIQAALAYLAEADVDPDRQAVLGFCMGGSVALFAATQLPLAAAVTFYGGGVSAGRFGIPPLQDIAGNIACPWLGLFGEQDPTIPPADIEALRAGVARATAPTELLTYPDAGHGFNCDERSTYVPAAAARAWEHTLAFLDDRIPAPAAAG